jgi:general secretion pathway protein J
MRSAVRCRLPARNRGFTLLELLVAMFIAAVIFAMGYGAINQAVKNRIELEEHQDKLLELQTAMRTLAQDFAQLAQRPVRDPVGGTYQPALVSNANAANTSGTSANTARATTRTSSNTTQAVVALTRSGWTNPTGLQRPALQRVAYYFENGTLRREYWTVLDPTQSSTAVRRDVMTHLKSVSFRFLDQGSTQGQQLQGGQAQPQAQAQNWKWSPIWPPLNGANQNNRRYRPIAVEITLETEDWGKVVRIVEVAG